MLKIDNRIKIPESKTSGIDCLEDCADKEHYLSYPKDITYRYNSRGFRDHEWPTDLSNVIWCVGDSSTVGLGQPFGEIWSQLLQEKTGKRCLNLGEAGCSNDTMALRIQEIVKSYNAKTIVVMWSYFSRRRINNINVQYDAKDFGEAKDFDNFIKNYEMVNALPTRIINLVVPRGLDNLDMIAQLKQRYPDLLFVKQLDYARDGHHFDIKTSIGVCDWVAIKYNEFDKSSK